MPVPQTSALLELLAQEAPPAAGRRPAWSGG